MLPVFPVFHTEESVRLSLNSKRNKDIQSRDEISKLGQRAPRLSFSLPLAWMKSKYQQRPLLD